MGLDKEKGNILVSSLLILVVINLLGLGLVQASVTEAKIASYKSIDAGTLHTSDSCSQEVIAWFETQTTTPSTIPTFSESDLSFMYTGTETTIMQNKLSGFSYNCTTSYITSQVTNSGAISGGEIGNVGGSYSSNANLSPKDYYTITSVGNGPKNSTKTTYTIISVEY